MKARALFDDVDVFQLHDGEDQDKTETLHVFMGDYPWDGDEAGVVIDEKLCKPGDWIVKCNGKIAIFSKDIFPKLFEVL